jgi:hypothetical protein
MYPWAAYLPRHGFDPAAHPRLTAWRETIDARPAAKRVAGAMAEMAAGLAVLPTNEQFDRTHPMRTAGAGHVPAV